MFPFWEQAAQRTTDAGVRDSRSRLTQVLKPITA